MNPKLEVRESSLGGRGVFARERINADEMLFVMGGYILTLEEDNDFRGEVADKAIEISDYFFIGPRNKEDMERMPQHFVNHSCEPNAGFKGQIFMMAMRSLIQVRRSPMIMLWSCAPLRRVTVSFLCPVAAVV